MQESSIGAYSIVKMSSTSISTVHEDVLVCIHYGGKCAETQPLPRGNVG